MRTCSCRSMRCGDLTPAVLSNPVDRYADEPPDPEIAVRNGLGRALQVAQVQDIVDNARQQRPRASDGELVEAFLFYYDRDAFIDFSRSAEQ